MSQAPTELAGPEPGGSRASEQEVARLRAALAAAERGLRECEERFRTVLDQSIDVVYRRNLEKDCYDYISPAIETVSGFTAEEFSRIKSAELLSYIHPEDHAVVLRRLAQFERSRFGEKVDGFFEFRLRRKEGGYRWISDSGVLVSAPDGTPLYHVGVARDITEQKRIEESLRQSNEELERKVAERTDRLRRLASELSLAEQRERKRLSDFLHDDLQQVLVAAKLEAEKRAGLHAGLAGDGGDKLADLLAEALGKTRAIVNELVTPLLYVVGLVPALYQLAEQVDRRHGLHVALDIQEVPEVLPETVRIQIFQSVQELLFNVAKHAGTSAAVVGVNVCGGELAVSVADAGKGFDAAAALTASQDGGGYGLYSISERMSALGGRMEVSSAPGQETRVTLVLPLSADEGRGAAEAPAEAAAPAPAEPPQEEGRRFRVLVADDHDVVRRGIIALLSHAPFLSVVGQAANGQDVCELVERLRPDIVLMDIQMPVMDGIEATRWVKKAFPETLVLGLSAFTEEGFRRAMLSAGAAELLDKAEAGDALIPALERLVRATV